MLNELLGPKLCRRCAVAWCCILCLVIFILIIPVISSIQGWVQPLWASSIFRYFVLGLFILSVLSCLYCCARWQVKRMREKWDEEDIPEEEPLLV